MRSIYLLPVLLILFFSYSIASNIKVEQFVCSEKIVNRIPIKISNTFSTELDKVYCFTKVKTNEIPTHIYHVWYKNGKKLFEIKLNVKYHFYRTWSYKRISSNDVGDWKVELLDNNKNKIAETYFKILTGSSYIDKNDNIKTEKDISEEVNKKSEELNKNSVEISDNNKRLADSNKRVEDSLKKDKEINSKDRFTQENFSYQKSEDKSESLLSKGFYLILLTLFYIVFFPTVYFLNKKLNLK